MSWNIIEKNKTPTSQYLNVKLQPSPLNVTNDLQATSSFNILGYSHTSVSYHVKTGSSFTTLKIILQGSNDGINFFNISSTDHTSAHSANEASHYIVDTPTKFIRLTYQTISGGSPQTQLENVHIISTT